MIWESLSNLAGIAALLALYTSITLWAVRALLKKESANTAAQLRVFTAQDQKFEKELRSIQRELRDLELKVAQEYIRREDAVVFFSRFEQKIDKLWDYLHKPFAQEV